MKSLYCQVDINYFKPTTAHIQSSATHYKDEEGDGNNYRKLINKQHKVKKGHKMEYFVIYSEFDKVKFLTYGTLEEALTKKQNLFDKGFRCVIIHGEKRIY